MTARQDRCLGRTGLALLVVALAVSSAPADEGPPAVPLERTLENPPATGLAVRTVQEGSQAAGAGIEPGDVIVSYDGTATPTIEALREAMGRAAMSSKDGVDVVVVGADGKERRHRIQSGPIGVGLAPVEKGKAVGPLPPATEVAFDFSRLALAPWDDWYAFQVRAADGSLAGKQGFEHATLALEKDRLLLRREVAFDGGAQWGVNHFDVTVVMETKPRLALVEMRFENPLTSFAGTGTVTRLDDGTRELQFAWRNDATDESGAQGGPLPADLPAIPGYLVESLAVFMPREPGACWHFRPIVDGWGTLEPRSALLCVGPEAIELDGKPVETTRYEHRQIGGVTTGTYWVGPEGRVVQADYGGAQARRAAKAAALADLHERIKPRSAE